MTDHVDRTQHDPLAHHADQHAPTSLPMSAAMEAVRRACSEADPPIHYALVMVGPDGARLASNIALQDAIETMRRVAQELETANDMEPGD